MTLAAPNARASSIGPVIAVTVGSIWAVVSALAFTQADSFNPVNVLDWVATVSFSLALAALAAAAWLISELSGRSKPVVVAAAILAIGGLVAAIGNFIEDGLGVKAFGVMYELGVGGVLAGLVGLAVTLAFGRRFRLAALAAATFAGVLMSSEAGGGFLILASWLVVAVGLRRG
jgi:hypothetical protein